MQNDFAAYEMTSGAGILHWECDQMNGRTRIRIYIFLHTFHICTYIFVYHDDDVMQRLVTETAMTHKMAAKNNIQIQFFDRIITKNV